MKKYDKITTVIWNSDEDDYSVALYQALLDEDWTPGRLYFREDKSKWLKLDSKIRQDIVTSIFISKLIEHSVGTILLPILVEVVGEEFATRRAMLSTMAARINGNHSLMSSQMLTNLNSQSLIKRGMEIVGNEPGLAKALFDIENMFEAVRGWSLAYQTYKKNESDESFDNLNEAIWRACSIAAVLLEVSHTTTIALLSNDERAKGLNNITKALSLTLRDRTIMTSYLSLIARSKLMLLPNEKAEEAQKAVVEYIKFIFTDFWYQLPYLSPEVKMELDCISNYGYYNVNKALTKLQLEPIYSVHEMPKNVEEFLKVNNSLKEAKVSKRVRWWK